MFNNQNLHLREVFEPRGDKHARQLRGDNLRSIETDKLKENTFGLYINLVRFEFAIDLHGF